MSLSLRRRVLSRLLRSGRISHSQCGEDLIIEFYLESVRKKPKITYLDIGANHPFVHSNTYRFYSEGHSGICVEPDPMLAERIRRKRPRDVVLKVGVCAGVAGNAKFFIMSDRVLNTFNAEMARRCDAQTAYKIVEEVDLPMIPIVEVIEKSCPVVPDFVSLDVEGLDLEIMRTFDFSRHRPELFCIETIDFVSGCKDGEMVQLMKDGGYEVFADTRINTIFVDKRFL